MKSKKNKKSKRQKDKSHKKCIIVTSEQMQAVKESIKGSGQAVFLGATITAVSLFSSGCASFCDRDDWMEAGKTSSSPQQLAELLKECANGNNRVKVAIAGNPKTPASVLAKLAEDKEEWVRRGVAGNPKTPASVLEKLAKDPSNIVKAVNPKTPADVLAKLAEDKDWFVKGAVARNPNTPKDIITKIETFCSQNCTSNCIASCTGGCTGECTGCTWGCIYGCIICTGGTGCTYVSTMRRGY